ncbi:MAG TPA: type II secretion system protein N [Povalibacter sp.]|uniref:type II secretion system protein N n=1 Tax=Povalibacter sp. TaxID=1962978 RepID=UPI002C2B58C4|nr:type II secretion system protein N [Povalibacter sp.]HMN43291.1 type II secretion system protein N [Povalibacter sp.]
MKKVWLMVALGVAAYLVFALVTVPASVVASFLPPGVVAAGTEGTAWNGRAATVVVGGAPIGSITWKLHALPLLALKLKADVKVTRSDGFLQATVATSGGEDLSLTQFTGSLPLASLPPGAMPGGWTGTLNMRLARLDLTNGWPVGADGTLEVIDLVGPARKPVGMGSYKIIFPPELTGNELVGALSDMGGPLEIAGNVRLSANRSYLIEGSVATRPEASQSMTDSLQILGTPDAQGRRPFSLSGTM